MQVKHDAFARGAYDRECVKGGGECGLCGCTRARLYIYAWRGDDNNRPRHYASGRKFCNFECFRSYYLC